jgi:hypothetical protein
LSEILIENGISHFEDASPHFDEEEVKIIVKLIRNFLEDDNYDIQASLS